MAHVDTLAQIDRYDMASRSQSGYCCQQRFAFTLRGDNRRRMR
jgi:hypothetical protein